MGDLYTVPQCKCLLWLIISDFGAETGRRQRSKGAEVAYTPSYRPQINTNTDFAYVFPHSQPLCIVLKWSKVQHSQSDKGDAQSKLLCKLNKLRFAIMAIYTIVDVILLCKSLPSSSLFSIVIREVYFLLSPLSKSAIAGLRAIWQWM